MAVFYGLITPAESTLTHGHLIAAGGATCARAVHAGRKRGFDWGLSFPLDTVFISESSSYAIYKADAKD